MVLDEAVNNISQNSNIIDRWILSLTEKFDGWGMILYVLITVSLAAILSALIGLERYRKGENAGMRTHALLAVGCSFLMTISLWAIRMPNPDLDYDIARIAAAAVTGIGFLGAGVIIKDKFTVKGLSTATTLWICAAVGLATGSGFILEAIIAVIVTMLIIFIRNKIVVKVDMNAPHVVIESDTGNALLEKVKGICDKNQLNLKNIEISEYKENKIIANAYFPYHTNPLLLDYFITEIKKEEGVKDAYVIMKKTKGNHNTPHES